MLFVTLLSTLSVLVIVFGDSDLPPEHEYGDSIYFEYASPQVTALVFFYASYHFNQKQRALSFDQLERKLKKRKVNVPILSVDCALKGKKLCAKYSVNEYPTYKLMRSVYFKTRMLPYRGPVKDDDEMIDYLKMVNSMKEFAGMQKLKKYLKSMKRPVVIGYFKLRTFFDKVTSFEEKFFQATDKVRDFIKIGYTYCTEITKGLELKNAFVIHYPISWQNDFQVANVTYSKNYTVKAMIRFISWRMFGLFPTRNDLNKDFLKRPLVVGYWSNSSKSNNYWKNRFLQTAKQYEGFVQFAYGDMNVFHLELKELGLAHLDSNSTLIVLGTDKNEHRYLFKGPFNNENLEKFVEDFQVGRAKRIRRSEPIPKPSNEHIMTIVANNFEERITNNVKDVIFMIYDPECRESQKLHWVFEQLAEEMEDEAVDFGKIDLTLNEIPEGYEVRETPTVYWSPKEAKDNPVLYRGDGNLTNLRKFVAKSATDELKHYDRNGNPKVSYKKIKLEF